MWQGGALDSRKVRGGELFFALRGEHADGHRFVPQALAAGAAAAVVERDLDLAEPGTAALIRVDDVYRGSSRPDAGGPPADAPASGRDHRLGGQDDHQGTARRRARAAFRTAKSPGNLNNLYGFPLALLSVGDDIEWMVAEMGMSTPGELRELSLLGRPDVAVFTVVRPVHLEFFGTLAAIAEAKSELLAGLAR